VSGQRNHLRGRRSSEDLPRGSSSASSRHVHVTSATSGSILQASSIASRCRPARRSCRSRLGPSTGLEHVPDGLLVHPLPSTLMRSAVATRASTCRW
jgi:hypothetical protein